MCVSLVREPTCICDLVLLKKGENKTRVQSCFPYHNRKERKNYLNPSLQHYCLVRSWRVGCNLPSVLMWHSADRATRTSGRFFISACLPFPLAGRPFHRFSSGILNNLACIIGACWMDVSFLLRSQGSRPTPFGRCNSTCGAEFPQA